MNTQKSTPLVAGQNEWDKVAAELEKEDLKLASYDTTLVPLLGDVRSKVILDHGAGPGVLALALKRLGAEVKAWDVNAEMRAKTAQKLGKENVY